MSGPRDSAAAAPSTTSGLPILARWVLIGAVGFGVAGGVVGLVLGLIAHPPTAWFAVLEVAIPSGVLGALLGLAAGSVAFCVRRLLGARRRRS